MLSCFLEELLLPYDKDAEAEISPHTSLELLEVGCGRKCSCGLPRTEPKTFKRQHKVDKLSGYLFNSGTLRLLTDHVVFDNAVGWAVPAAEPRIRKRAERGAQQDYYRQPHPSSFIIIQRQRNLEEL